MNLVCIFFLFSQSSSAPPLPTIWMTDGSLLAKTAVQSEFAPHKYPALLCEKKLQRPSVNILSHGSGFYIF